MLKTTSTNSTLPTFFGQNRKQFVGRSIQSVHFYFQSDKHADTFNFYTISKITGRETRTEFKIEKKTIEETEDMKKTRKIFNETNKEGGRQN